MNLCNLPRQASQSVSAVPVDMLANRPPDVSSRLITAIGSSE